MLLVHLWLITSENKLHHESLGNGAGLALKSLLYNRNTYTVVFMFAGT